MANMVDSASPDVVVIGAGHNGLAAAFYLAKAGRKVLVLERRDVVGGGAITSEIHPGFTCPTLSHEVLLHDRIAHDMRLHEHGVQWLTPPVEVTALAPDGPPLVLDQDVAHAAESIARFERVGEESAPRDGSRHGSTDGGADGSADADAYLGFVRMRDRFARVLSTMLTVPPPQLDAGALGGVSLGDAWHLLKAGRAFRALGSRDAGQMLRWLPMPVADLLTDTFSSERLRAAIAGPGLSGAAMGPRSGGSVLLLLMRAAHAQLSGGRGRRVMGGPGRLTEAMAAAARSAGVDIRTEQPVERVLVRDGRVAGLVAGGRDIPTRCIVSAVDPKTTFERLVGPDHLPADFRARVGHLRAAGSLAKVNLALSALPRFHGIDDARSLSGRVHIGASLDAMERAFDHVKYGEIATEPWLEVTFPSIADPTLAPAGQHVASIYVHYAPATLRGSDWSTARGRLLDSVLRLLEQYAPGIASLVLATQVITPADLEAEYGFAGGHIFHGEMALDQLFSLRPVMGYASYATPIAGLYLCSAGTHPGGFLCGVSGRLAAERVLAR